MKLFISRLLPVELLRPAVDAGCSIDMYENDSPCPRDEFVRRCLNVDALLVQVTDSIDAEICRVAPHLKVVACCSVGFDNIDVETVESSGAIVCNAPAPDLIATTAEAAVALLLGVAKRVTRLHLAQQSGDLPPYSIMYQMGVPIRDRVSGIVGIGRIGGAIAKIMKRGFGNSILYNGRSARTELEQTLGARRRSLQELLAESDFVFVVVPLVDETRNLLSRQVLKHLRRDSIVVNVSRAGVIDERALTDMLSEGRIFGAGLDVYGAGAEKCRHPNLVLTAHMANGEVRAMSATVELAVRNIVAVLNNEAPLTPVTR